MKNVDLPFSHPLPSHVVGRTSEEPPREEEMKTRGMEERLKRRKKNDGTGHVLFLLATDGSIAGFIHVFLLVCVCVCSYVWTKTLLPLGSNRRSSVFSGGADYTTRAREFNVNGRV